MTIGYHIAENFIIFGFIFVAVIIIFTYLMKLLQFFINIYTNFVFKTIKRRIKKAIFLRHKFVPKKFKIRYRNLGILLKILHEFDQTVKSDEWSEVRKVLIRQVMLPLARKYSTSRKWIKRFYAVNTFILLSEEHDDKYIVKLIHDDIPFIYLHAITAGLMHQSENTVNAVIKKMSLESWTSQSTALEAFDNTPAGNRQFIEKMIHHTNDISVKTACYHMLTKYPVGKHDWNINKDLSSTNVELRIAVIKYAALLDHDLSVSLLRKALNDDVSDVKVIALFRLNLVKAEEAIHDIAKCLDDEDMTVRVVTAGILKNFGEKGLKALQSANPELRDISYHLIQALENK